jgi:hypothetical protein
MDETGVERNAHGVDVTLIDWFLTLTPSERLDALQGFVDDIEAIRQLNGQVS